jgi:hypothetical protein
VDPKSGKFCNDVGQMEAVMQVNFFGTVRVLLKALPLLPDQGEMSGVVLHHLLILDANAMAAKAAEQLLYLPCTYADPQTHPGPAAVQLWHKMEALSMWMGVTDPCRSFLVAFQAP